MAYVQTNVLRVASDSVANIVIALAYFVILGVEFFVRYKIKFNHQHKYKQVAEKEGK